MWCVMFLKNMIEDSVLECPLDNGDNKEIENKVVSLIHGCFVVGLHMNKKRSKFQSKTFKK